MTTLVKRQPSPRGLKRYNDGYPSPGHHSNGGASPKSKKGKKSSIPQAFYPHQPDLIVFDREFEDLPEPQRTQI